MRTIIYTLFLVTILASCNNGIPKDKLTVIENITLGQPSNSYVKQFDSLLIPHTRFFNEILIRNFNSLLDNSSYYYSYYTTMFNFSEYRIPKNSVEHLGLITAVTLEGTQNNFALIISLCHTVDPWFMGDAASYKSSTNEKFVRQEVNDSVIEKVKRLYISKYGTPKSIDTSNFNTFWRIDGNTLSKENDDSHVGITYQWETEYYTVKFFTGMDFNGIYVPGDGYVESTNGYASNLGNERADPLKNQMNCKAYAYIYYELNTKAMNELKTDNKKL